MASGITSVPKSDVNADIDNDNGDEKETKIIRHGLHRLWNNPLFSDVTVHVGEQKLMLHRVILTCHSKFFEGLFTSSDSSSSSMTAYTVITSPSSLDDGTIHLCAKRPLHQPAVIALLEWMYMSSSHVNMIETWVRLQPSKQSLSYLLYEAISLGMDNHIIAEITNEMRRSIDKDTVLSFLDSALQFDGVLCKIKMDCLGSVTTNEVDKKLNVIKPTLFPFTFETVRTPSTATVGDVGGIPKTATTPGGLMLATDVMNKTCELGPSLFRYLEENVTFFCGLPSGAGEKSTSTTTFRLRVDDTSKKIDLFGLACHHIDFILSRLMSNPKTRDSKCGSLSLLLTSLMRVCDRNSLPYTSIRSFVRSILLLFPSHDVLLSQLHGIFTRIGLSTDHVFQSMYLSETNLKWGDMSRDRELVVTCLPSVFERSSATKKGDVHSSNHVTMNYSPTFEIRFSRVVDTVGNNPWSNLTFPIAAETSYSRFSQLIYPVEFGISTYHVVFYGGDKEDHLRLGVTGDIAAAIGIYQHPYAGTTPCASTFYLMTSYNTFKIVQDHMQVLHDMHMRTKEFQWSSYTAPESSFFIRTSVTEVDDDDDDKKIDTNESKWKSDIPLTSDLPVPSGFSFSTETATTISSSTVSDSSSSSTSSKSVSSSSSLSSSSSSSLSSSSSSVSSSVSTSHSDCPKKERPNIRKTKKVRLEYTLAEEKKQTQIKDDIKKDSTKTCPIVNRFSEKKRTTVEEKETSVLLPTDVIRPTVVTTGPPTHTAKTPTLSFPSRSVRLPTSESTEENNWILLQDWFTTDPLFVSVYVRSPDMRVRCSLKSHVPLHV